MRQDQVRLQLRVFVFGPLHLKTRVPPSTLRLRLQFPVGFVEWLSSLCVPGSATRDKKGNKRGKKVDALSHDQAFLDRSSDHNNKSEEEVHSDSREKARMPRSEERGGMAA